tara:strand:+ start:1803 stop:2207 length:405 start_codon:yes stop_codon:yes gene_type:complete
MSEKETKLAKKATPVSAKRRASAEAKKAADKRAAELLEQMNSMTTIQMGTVVNGEEGWVYKFIPRDASARVRGIATQDLEAKGYERCTSKGVHISGFPDAEVWQLPRAIASRVKQLRTKEIEARNRETRKGYIL